MGSTIFSYLIQKWRIQNWCVRVSVVFLQWNTVCSKENPRQYIGMKISFQFNTMKQVIYCILIPLSYPDAVQSRNLNPVVPIPPLGYRGSRSKIQSFHSYYWEIALTHTPCLSTDPISRVSHSPRFQGQNLRPLYPHRCHQGESLWYHRGRAGKKVKKLIVSMGTQNLNKTQLKREPPIPERRQNDNDTIATFYVLGSCCNWGGGERNNNRIPTWMSLKYIRGFSLWILEWLTEHTFPFGKKSHPKLF